MRIAKLEFYPVSIAYKRRECSYQVDRDGVSDIVVKAVTDDGIVGWGESCSGADLNSVLEALRAMSRFVIGRSPWQSEAIRTELWHSGLWNFRKGTASFAYAGIDMALWDICGKASGQPLFNLLGGRVRDCATYFFYLSWSTEEDLERQCREAVARGFRVFYLKVGKNAAVDRARVGFVRSVLGPDAVLRLDANGAWSVAEAIRILNDLAQYDIDFIEQPVCPDPASNMCEVRARCRIPVCANEGLWTAEDAYRQIRQRLADVYCFSSYWVGSLVQFQQLARLCAFEGFRVCKHTHGEFGIAAAAAHHVMLTLPNIVEGNQQTAHAMQDDILTERIPIADGPDWGIPDRPGLGVDVDEDKLAKYHEQHMRMGQYLPYAAKLQEAFV